MNKDVDACGWRELAKGTDDRAVGEKIAVKVSGFDIEDVDEDTDVGEDVLALLREVILHKGILTGRC
jgi:hypothetical protein